MESSVVNSFFLTKSDALPVIFISFLLVFGFMSGNWKAYDKGGIKVYIIQYA